MPDPTPPGDAGGAAGRPPGPLTPAAIDAVLADFRRWLEDLAAAAPEPPSPPEPSVDLATLVAAFTALRHEVNLQTKATRAQAEQVARLVETWEESGTESPASDDDLLPLLDTLIELHDGLLLAEREVTAARDPLPDPA